MIFLPIEIKFINHFINIYNVLDNTCSAEKVLNILRTDTETHLV